MSKHIIHKLFSHGAESGATALVINRSKQGLIFNYTYPDGSEQNFSLPAHLGSKLLDSLRKMLKISENDLRPKQNFKLKEKNYQIDFNLTIIPDKEGEKIIIKIIKKNNKFWRLKQLGFQRESLKIIGKIKKIKSGLIIIASPENNGKSTTLRALLNELNTESINAYFLENNPKQIIPGINYLAPNKNNWDKILKHDCDLIIFDDLKKDEDWIKAIEAANTGRLVIVTVTAESSLEIILKILQLDLPPLFKINCLKIIIGQRLVDLKRTERFKKISHLLETRGKIAIGEIIDLSQTLKKYLIDNSHNHKKETFWKKFNEIMIKDGFSPFSHDLFKKIKNGSVKK